MLKFDDVKNKLKQDLKILNENEVIILECFKKDRRVIIKKENNSFNVFEEGFIKKQENLVDLNECIKYVIKRINFEFPRSKNLWYHFREEK